jgi:hypothetical protein
LNSVTNSPNLSATSLPALEEQEQHDSAAAHAPAISPDTPHEAETAPKDEEVRAIASAFDGPSSASPAHVTASPAHVLAHSASSATSGPAIHEEPAAPDYKRMSKADVAGLKPADFRRSLLSMSGDDYEDFKSKMTEGQKKLADKVLAQLDEEEGIRATHPQTIQQPLRPPARTGPNKLRKNPPPGYTPPDYTEYNRLQGIPPRPGQGVLSRAVELKTAQNRARGELFPRFSATLDVGTSATALGIAAKKTVKGAYGSGKDLVKKLGRRGADEGNS